MHIKSDINPKKERKKAVQLRGRRTGGGPGRIQMRPVSLVSES
jgi:hypothetical protein